MRIVHQYNKKEPLSRFFFKNRDDTIRTCDPFVPSEVRYQAALHPDNLFIQFSNLFQAQLGLSIIRLHRTYRFSIRLPYYELSTGHFVAGNLLHPDKNISNEVHENIILNKVKNQVISNLFIV